MEPTVSALQAQISDLAAQVSRLKIRPADTATGTVQVPSSRAENGLTLIDEVEIAADTSTGVGWTTQEVSSYVPSGATALLLRLYDVSAADLTEFYFRTTNGMKEMKAFAWNPSGGGSQISPQVTVPVRNQKFDYKVSKASSGDWSITLLGYFS